jgi:hypothetical protein|tara:strand:+ start:764 stop:967 length:204 start_codon:yes stop_codon:yes gene_type:complete
MRKLEKLIINKIRNRNFRIGIQEPAVIKKLYKNYSDKEIKNLPKFDNILGTCEKGWGIDQTIQTHFW